ncbi:MAG: hypothetical protein F6J87_01790 [Spirulina sp. SIO3F2]|nr:hypothetical protein [Spirulina sp. SIO3F2]
MKFKQSAHTLKIDGSVPNINTFLALGVGSVFLITGLMLLNSAGIHPVSLLFTVLGVLTLISFCFQQASANRTYIFNCKTRRLNVKQTTIPFTAIKNVAVRESKWTGSYGKEHISYRVTFSAETYGHFSLPANDRNEAENVVNAIKAYLKHPPAS